VQRGTNPEFVMFRLVALVGMAVLTVAAVAAVASPRAKLEQPPEGDREQTSSRPRPSTAALYFHGQFSLN
jgi:hypothetical protein